MGKVLFRAVLGLSAGAILFSSTMVFGQNWPERPVRTSSRCTTCSSPGRLAVSFS